MSEVNITPPYLHTQDIVRFWKYVDKTHGHGSKGDCWEWIGTRSPLGYGKFTTTLEYEVGARPVFAHRLAYFLNTGRWTKLLVCHHCDNPPCCNPSHLFEGTDGENMADKVRKRRHLKRPEDIPRGEACVMAKLTESDVKEIRAMYASGGYSYHELGVRFKVSLSMIHRIAKRKAWTHI